MDIQEEIRINIQQPMVLASSEIGKLFVATVEDMKKNEFYSCNNAFVLMSVAYNYGLVHGKRAERARKKRGAAVD